MRGGGGARRCRPARVPRLRRRRRPRPLHWPRLPPRPRMLHSPRSAYTPRPHDTLGGGPPPHHKCRPRSPHHSRRRPRRRAPRGGLPRGDNGGPPCRRRRPPCPGYVHYTLHSTSSHTLSTRINTLYPAPAYTGTPSSLRTQRAETPVRSGDASGADASQFIYAARLGRRRQLAGSSHKKRKRSAPCYTQARRRAHGVPAETDDPPAGCHSGPETVSLVRTPLPSARSTS